MMRRPAIPRILLRIAALLVLVLLIGHSREAEPPPRPPEQSESEAPLWDPANRPPLPAYHWPADFKLPVEISIEVPEVPEEIQGPWPSIQEK